MRTLCPQTVAVCSVSYPDANVPGDGTVGSKNTAAFFLGGRSKSIGFAVRWLHHEMMMAMPAATIQPETEGIVLRRIPIKS